MKVFNPSREEVENFIFRLVMTGYSQFGVGVLFIKDASFANTFIIVRKYHHISPDRDPVRGFMLDFEERREKHITKTGEGNYSMNSLAFYPPSILFPRDSFEGDMRVDSASSTFIGKINVCQYRDYVRDLVAMVKL